MTDSGADTGTQPDWQRWIGRSETSHDAIGADLVAKLAATLNRTPPETILPPGWHWIFFNEVVPRDGLASDGHAKRGEFLPPITLPRRMWAGGRLTWRRDLAIDHAVTRTSTIRSVAQKQGGSGPLAFVTVAHAIADEQQLVLEEEHDIVYRGHAPAGTVEVKEADEPRETIPPEGPWCRRFVADSVLLFRYSALTFNGHRIHYDRVFATEIEGYPDLVVHGPLIATLLLDLVATALPQRRLARFSYRARAPLFADRPFYLVGSPERDAVSLMALDETGRVAMTGKAELG